MHLFTHNFSNYAAINIKFSMDQFCVLREHGVKFSENRIAFDPTYIIGHYNSSVRIIVNFKRERRDLQFNVDSERQIFEKLFDDRFIYFQSFSYKSAER